MYYFQGISTRLTTDMWQEALTLEKHLLIQKRII